MKCQQCNVGEIFYVVRVYNKKGEAEMAEECKTCGFQRKLKVTKVSKKK